MLFLAAGVSRPHVGDPTPTFKAQTLEGQSVNGAKLHGQVTVVEFFASWCQPCKESLSETLAIRDRLASRFGLMVVSVDSEIQPLKDFIASHPLPAGAILVLDGDGTLARSFGEDRLPTTFFLDSKMIIRHINRGHGKGFRERATRWLADMLAMHP
jgi:peroxiredoxin